jgi:hypothetical protein
VSGRLGGISVVNDGLSFWPKKKAVSGRLGLAHLAPPHEQRRVFQSDLELTQFSILENLISNKFFAFEREILWNYQEMPKLTKKTSSFNQSRGRTAEMGTTEPGTPEGDYSVQKLNQRRLLWERARPLLNVDKVGCLKKIVQSLLKIMNATGATGLLIIFHLAYCLPSCCLALSVPISFSCFSLFLVFVVCVLLGNVMPLSASFPSLSPCSSFFALLFCVM